MNHPDQHKIIKNTLGLLELAHTLDNVSQACRVMGYFRDSLYRYLNRCVNKQIKEALLHGEHLQEKKLNCSIPKSIAERVDKHPY